MKYFRPYQGLRYDFTQNEKASIITVLEKFGDSNQTINSIYNMVTTEGWTSLHADEALMLAGLLLPWYEFLSKRIVAHPSMFQDN